ncbi:protein eyes shut homolog [Tachysurus ichikawai]
MLQSYQCVCDLGWEGMFCERETNECASNPCKNNSTCTDLFNAYRCTCPPGWTGPDCGEDVKGCISGPCFNGALCVESDYPSKFSCTCPPFFTGSLCTLPYNPCDVKNNPCLNNSTCRSRPDGSAKCLCPAGEIQQFCRKFFQEQRKTLIHALCIFKVSQRVHVGSDPQCPNNNAQLLRFGDV